jgi:hypothetical protein
MSLLDLLFLLAQVAIPFFLAAVAFGDWRSFRRTRYLVFTGLYVFFALAIAADYYAGSSDSLVCLGSYFWILIAAIIHLRSRRIDRTANPKPPAT